MAASVLVLHPSSDDAGVSLRTAGQVLAGVVRVLAAGDPTIWQRLLTDHVADGAGCCTVCRRNGVGGSVWPCTLRCVAEDARRLVERSND